jgi:hypothetical protein
LGSIRWPVTMMAPLYATTRFSFNRKAISTSAVHNFGDQ